MNHVEYLSKLVPFGNASFKDIISELQDTPSISIETKCITVVKDHCRKGVGLIILTGNAGHGKTFICREVLFDFLNKDRSDSDHFKDISKLLLGEEISDKGVESGEGKKLVVHKDLSDMSTYQAADLLHKGLSAAKSKATLVCVNEGRLRETINEIKDPDTKKRIRAGLEHCINDGVSSTDSDLTFINMNYQSVTAIRSDGTTLVEQTLKEWLDNDALWLPSGEHGLDNCPIMRNRELLISGTNESKRRRHGIVFLFRLAELFGHSTTIREMIMTLAYIITGGLTFEDVKNRNRGNDKQWQSKYAFHQLIFGEGRTESELELLPLLKKIKCFDPSRCSWRKSDDNYIVGMDRATQKDSDLSFDHLGNKRDAHETMQGGHVEGTGTESGDEEAESIKKAVILLRRRDFFDLWSEDSQEENLLNQERANRLGLLNYSSFERLLNDSENCENEKKELIKALHALQGITPWNHHITTSKLRLLHSAFIKANSDYSPINREIKKGLIEINSEPQAWRANDGSLKKISDTCDWRHNNLYLKIDNKELLLTLERYSYLIKASEGYYTKSFYSSDVERIQNFLSNLSSTADDCEEDTLKIVSLDGVKEYTIDNNQIEYN